MPHRSDAQWTTGWARWRGHRQPGAQSPVPFFCQVATLRANVPASLCGVCWPSAPEAPILRPIKMWYINRLIKFAMAVNSIAVSVDGDGEPVSSQLLSCLSGMICHCCCVLAAVDVNVSLLAPGRHRRVSMSTRTTASSHPDTAGLPLPARRCCDTSACHRMCRTKRTMRMRGLRRGDSPASKPDHRSTSFCGR
jgi:hypothetical protein